MSNKTSKLLSDLKKVRERIKELKEKVCDKKKKQKKEKVNNVTIP